VAQSPKVIDVTRSFVPVDPNAYPENLHGTGSEDYPEDRVPVVPYMGHNFLPTGYGYKSFFGTNSAIRADTLVPNKPDHVFLFQTLTFKNVLIALCDTGLWAKDSTVEGAWEQLKVYTAPGDDEFYEWYYEVIKNKLYCFRANAGEYLLIETDALVDIGISCTEVVPTFITPTAQLGMGKLGARLCFWDAENAIAWSSPDDLAEFTPDVLTGANVTTFNSVLGRIAGIHSHGKHAVVVASNSIVGLEVQAGDTFFVKAKPILPKVGAPYFKMAAKGEPDTTLFVYSSAGIVKITNFDPEFIIPEVYDYFKTYTAVPIYLKLLQGRFLAFEILDENLMNGVPIFSVTTLPSSSVDLIDIPDSLDDINDDETIEDDICPVLSLINAGNSTEQSAQADDDIPETYTHKEPVYTCWLSMPEALRCEGVTWGSTPCGWVGPSGKVFDQSPVNGEGYKTSWSTGDSTTNKTMKTGETSWTDGKWTMERFLQTQTALWKAHESTIQSFLTCVSSKADRDSATVNAASCVAASPASAGCAVATYAAEYSSYIFGYNVCSFWLTRYITKTADLTTTKATTETCLTPIETLSQWRFSGHDWGATDSGYIYASAQAAANAAQAAYESVWGGGSRGAYYLAETISTSPGGNILSYQVRATVGDGSVCLAQRTVSTTTYPKKTDVAVRNDLSYNAPGVYGNDTAFCLLTHWRYTDASGVSHLVPATTCIAENDLWPGTNDVTRPAAIDDPRRNPLGEDGSICGQEFEAPLDIDVVWTDETLEYPGDDFLIQQGSIAPKYPTIYGAFVYDLHLKKWGKYKEEYKLLVNYSPLNSEAIPAINFANFGILAGSFKADGFVYVFDDAPADSRITWGKVGYYRLGYTNIQEIRFDFKTLFAGEVIVDISMDGRNLASPYSYSQSFPGVRQAVVYPPYNARWFNFTLNGKFDVVLIEVRGNKEGKR
jgi:hypothetical protein